MIRVYGSSDDLVEIEGDLTEEFSGDNLILGFSNGLLLRIEYSPSATWFIRPLNKPKGVFLDIQFAPENDDDNYSDVAVIEYSSAYRPEWVVAGLEFAR
jgi:hypothetical protein